MYKHSLIKPLALATALFFAAIPLVASAHGDEASMNRTIGNYTVDIGYDPTIPVAGSAEKFDLKLWRGTEDAASAAGFAQVWVRILKDDGTLLATGIVSQPIGPTTLLYTFPAAGEYEIETSFRDVGGSDIAMASFPISVVAGANGTPMNWPPLGIASVVGFVIGAIATYLLLRR